MDLEAVRSWCIGQPGATEGFPFGEGVLVFKVGGKIFALLSLDDQPAKLSLKCDPERAVELRERYAAIGPGYHLNKRHWNTVRLDGTVPPTELRGQIDHAHALVVSGLPKAVRAGLGQAEGSTAGGGGS